MRRSQPLLTLLRPALAKQRPPRRTAVPRLRLSSAHRDRGGPQRRAFEPGLLVMLYALLAALGCSALAADGSARAQTLHDFTHFADPSPVALASPTPQVTPAPEPAISFAARELETGVAFPRWSTAGYSAADTGWGTGLGEIQQQTNAGWIEMMIQFYQTSQGSTTVYAGPTTPSPASLADGIRSAHRMGFHVFVVPLLGVLRGQPWGGAIHFASYAQTRAWFSSYWNALEPYMQAAAETGAEQFAIGTELSALELAGDGFWYTLIGSAHATFPGKLTYDMNWSTLGDEPRGWMSDARLCALGISEYAPISGGPWALSTEQIAAVWQQRVVPSLDRLSAAAGKPVILSEIGYRNSHDALYHPWDHSSRARQDPALQASAYEAALDAVYAASSVSGIFFWAWSVDAFAPNNLPAAHVLHTYYGYYGYQAWLARQRGLHTRRET